MRCYNGCPDSEFQALIDNRARLKKRMNELNPEARCTYYPMGEFYLVFVGFRPISPEFKSYEAAHQWAIDEFSKDVV